MRTTLTAPRLPNHGDTVDLVLDGSGTFGQADRETDLRQADRQTILANLLSGQSERPLRIAACNTAEGWACDVTAEIAQEVLALADQDLSPAVRDVVERAR
jgi:hypothetical protein